MTKQGRCDKYLVNVNDWLFSVVYENFRNDKETGKILHIEIIGNNRVKQYKFAAIFNHFELYMTRASIDNITKYPLEVDDMDSECTDKIRYFRHSDTFTSTEKTALELITGQKIV